MHATKSDSTNHSVTATAPGVPQRLRWRVVDIVVAAVLGVASGVVFLGADLVYVPINVVLTLTPGLVGLTAGLWLFAGVLGGLIIRRPGAAILVSLIATLVETAVWNTWGLSNILFGLLQGAGAELAVALFLYKSSRIWVAIIGGALAAIPNAVLSFLFYYPDQAAGFYVTYTATAVISGVVIGGILAWLVARGLVRTGALNRFPIAHGS